MNTSADDIGEKELANRPYPTSIKPPEKRNQDDPTVVVDIEELRKIYKEAVKSPVRIKTKSPNLIDQITHSHGRHQYQVTHILDMSGSVERTLARIEEAAAAVASGVLGKPVRVRIECPNGEMLSGEIFRRRVEKVVSQLRDINREQGGAAGITCLSVFIERNLANYLRDR